MADLEFENDKEADEIGEREGIEFDKEVGDAWVEQDSDTGVGRYVRNTLLEMSLTIAKGRMSTRIAEMMPN